MTERQKKMIETYIPSQPGPDLEFGEFYMADSADRVIRVRVVSVSYSIEDYEIRRVVTVGRTQRGVYNARGEYGRIPGWYYPRALYDNKQDCRNDTHYMYDEWEALRKIQKAEAENG